VNEELIEVLRDIGGQSALKHRPPPPFRQTGWLGVADIPQHLCQTFSGFLSGGAS
jgi:hypothetical protein